MTLKGRSDPVPLKFDARLALLEAGADLFSEHGFDAVTTRTLCERAGVNLSAIKYYFDSKELYHRAVLEYLMAEVKEALGPALDALRDNVAQSGGNAVTIRASLGLFVKSWCNLVLSDPRTQRRMPFIVRELIRPTVDFDVVYKSFFRVLNETILELVVVASRSPRDASTLKVQTHAVLGQLLGFVIMEAVFWREIGWEGYSTKNVDKLVEPLIEMLARSLGLEDPKS